MVQTTKQQELSIRDQLEPGYYISYSGKKAIKVLHRLGHCFMLPGVEFLSHDYMGTVIPDSSSYETVCKWCAKKADLSGDMNSSASNTSSSTEGREVNIEVLVELRSRSSG